MKATILSLLLLISLHFEASLAQATGLLFVVGGESNGNVLSDVEIVDLQSDSPCSYKPVDFPRPSTGVSGIWAVDIPHFCGGSQTNLGGEADTLCNGFYPFSNTWSVQATQLTPRTRSALAYMNTEQFWITGGVSETDEILASTEIYNDHEDNELGVDLPAPREMHNLLQLDEDRYFLTGGRGDMEDGARTWIWSFADNEWTEVAMATENRVGQFAGLVTKSDGTRAVVVAGGEGSTTSEVFSLETMAWTAGPELPFPMHAGASVAFGDSFLLVGGHAEGEEDSGSIFYYDQVGNGFVQLPQSLVTPRRHHAAILVPATYVNCA